MSCPKNPKKWLFFKYTGPHQWDDPLISEFLSGKTLYIVRRNCDLCGLYQKKTVWNQKELQQIYPQIDMKKFNEAISKYFSIPGSVYLSEVLEGEENV